jgi:hypothetical protein
MILDHSQPSLTTAARSLWLGRGATATRADWLALLAIGAVAALLTAYVTLGIRIPGHAILTVVVPMVVGMGLVPRRGAGLVMALGAVLTGGAIALSDTGELPAAAFAGLAIAGPLLDLAAMGNPTGRGLYLRFALTGLAANMIVYAARWGVLWMGWESGGGGNFRRASLFAFGSFVVCGLLAGLVGAAIAFRPTAGNSPRE